jgi:hypothetical protein
MEQLRNLDERVLGGLLRRSSTPEQHRKTYLFGLAGTTCVLAVGLLWQWSYVLPGIGGFVGVMLGGGVRWWTSTPDNEEPPYQRTLLATGAVVLVAVIVAWASYWGDTTRRDPAPWPPNWQPAPGTMVVLCEYGDDRRNYTYQSTPDERLHCKDGGTPRVLVR